MSTQPPWQRPPSEQPPQAPAQSPPAQPPPDAPPAAPVPTQETPPGAVQAPPPSAPVAPPAAPPAPPPVFAPPPGGPRKDKTKLIVAIVGAVAVLGVAGAVVVVAGGKEEPTVVEPTRGSQQDPPPDPPSDPPPQPGPNDLRSLIQEQVAGYTLVGAEQDPEAISAGAADAYDMKYEAGGTTLSHSLWAFNSPDEAQAAVEAGVLALQEGGLIPAAEPQPLATDEGEQVGVLIILVDEQNSEVWLWANRNLFATAIGDSGQVEGFYRELPY